MVKYFILVYQSEQGTGLERELALWSITNLIDCFV